MTPERQKWWDSLPKEEKEIRKIIEVRKYRIHSLKKEMTRVIDEGRKNGWEPSPVVRKVFASYKREICEMQRFIKILRKQIALSPAVAVIGDTEYACCPICKHRLFSTCCGMCGQKIRGLVI